ncbi:chemotaxis protein CheD [Chakrabartia godavariana]|nr:chemotaxis protein CheD [Chakrabartia godavariana]
MTVSGLLADENRINVIQGDFHVSDGEQIVLSTVLGSCIAICLYDPAIRTGGMNHFLLAAPGGNEAPDPLKQRLYGAFAMEQLINEMLKRGANRSTMRAHIYGGSNINRAMAHIGTTNANFAREFLREDGIPISHEDTGGSAARRLDLKPATGQIRCKHIPTEDVPRIALPPLRPVERAPAGDVELF